MQQCVSTSITGYGRCQALVAETFSIAASHAVARALPLYTHVYAALPCADLVILLERGGNQLVQQLAEDLAHEQTNRSASSTVGARFREQLRDLISRLDKCGFHPHLDDMTCNSRCSCHNIVAKAVQLVNSAPDNLS